MPISKRVKEYLNSDAEIVISKMPLAKHDIRLESNTYCSPMTPIYYNRHG